MSVSKRRQRKRSAERLRGSTEPLDLDKLLDALPDLLRRIDVVLSDPHLRQAAYVQELAASLDEFSGSARRMWRGQTAERSSYVYATRLTRDLLTMADGLVGRKTGGVPQPVRGSGLCRCEF